MPLYVIDILHGFFGAMFVLRWAASRRARSRLESGSLLTSNGPMQVGTAPHAAITLALQLLAMGLLYLALVLTLLRVRPDLLMIGTPLFPPQRVVGATVMLLADCLLAWTMLVFGSWRLLARIGPTHELVTSGPFGLVRHPNYLAMNLLALGSFLWIPTAWVLVALVAVAATSELRARAEERLLIETFGERYENYLRGVRRWIPVLHRQQ